MKTLATMIALFACPVAGAQAPVKEKVYSLSFQDTPWPDVLAWLETQSGLTHVVTIKPKGTLTLKTEKPVTLLEVLSLLDSELERQGLNIFRGPQTFCVYPPDKPLPERIPKISLEDLPGWGDFERVQVVLTFDAHDAELIDERSVKKLLSRLGEARIFENQLIVTDEARNIRNIVGYFAPVLKPLPGPSLPPSVPTSPVVQPCIPQAMVCRCPPQPVRQRFRSRR